jgi:hypothetical protein
MGTRGFAKVVGLLVLSGLASSAWAAGHASFSTNEKLKVSKCGSDSGGVGVDFTLAGDGTWTAVSSGNTYTGTSVVAGKSIALTMDANSRAILAAEIADNASDLCDDFVTVTSLTVTKAMLKLNKSQTAAKVQFAATAAGSASGVTGSAKYALKGSGTWSTAQ